jgi:hypothetical protein
MKTQVVADRKTHQILCVDIFNGKAHDGTIFKKTLQIRPEILVLGDSGYRGIQKVHPNSMFPFRHAEDAKEMTREERKAYNKSVSSRRMKIEHIIGLIKRYKIVAERYRNHRSRFGLRMSLICGIINYENPQKLPLS